MRASLGSIGNEWMAPHPLPDIRKYCHCAIWSIYRGKLEQKESLVDEQDRGCGRWPGEMPLATCVYLSVYYYLYGWCTHTVYMYTRINNRRPLGHVPIESQESKARVKLIHPTMFISLQIAFRSPVSHSLAAYLSIYWLPSGSIYSKGLKEPKGAAAAGSTPPFL